MTVNDETTRLRIAQLVPCTEAEGPGKRFAIWVQGCPLRCAECCNPEMLSFDGGQLIQVHELLDRITDQAARGVEGITLLGGEPFAHAEPLSRLAQQVQQAGLSVMVFSGFRLSQLRALQDCSSAALLQHTDLLVDGPYDRHQPDTTRRWVGSTNQQIHFLSDRYSPEDPCWSAGDTLEIRLQGQQLTVNGFPAPSAIGLWKRPAKEDQTL